MKYKKIIIKSAKKGIKKGSYIQIKKSIKSSKNRIIPKNTVVEVISIKDKDVIIESPDEENANFNLDTFPFKIIKD